MAASGLLRQWHTKKLLCKLNSQSIPRITNEHWQKLNKEIRLSTLYTFFFFGAYTCHIPQSSVFGLSVLFQVKIHYGTMLKTKRSSSNSSHWFVTSSWFPFLQGIPAQRITLKLQNKTPKKMSYTESDYQPTTALYCLLWPVAPNSCKERSYPSTVTIGMDFLGSNWGSSVCKAGAQPLKHSLSKVM